MNKKSMIMLSSMLVTTGIMTSCGGETGQEENSEGQNQMQEESQEENGENASGDDTANIDNMTAEEPGKNETCYYCEMGIPHPEDEQSVFTAQAITNDGERVFFDDSGCVENAEQEQDEEFAKVWVKDYSSDEWTEREGTTVVADNSLETPMSYQYAFFEEEADADAYVEEHEAEAASWEDVQADAHERAQGGSMDHEEMNHEDMDSHDDEQDNS
ncbi:nitrous oxide reductase accessory protein NosL [Marinococcus sp. PL1-022]|uniref:nitrous oxide reductase accessory protein NosL n=1 Tax=Marinococcus sp. PL1-022 TaxID=3095363 RepID=UPI0029C48F58|nr:nitrous oxide reductase accessory protein NosL [Marinococcus sp. PL1-022]MDX6152647.1 nitrous oxide reductase accessory protein NosL [Marinococcus sp. PL1-022]